MKFTKDHTTVRTATSSKQMAQELLTQSRTPQRALQEAVKKRNRYHTDFWKEVVQYLSGTSTEFQEPEVPSG